MLLRDAQKCFFSRRDLDYLQLRSGEIDTRLYVYISAFPSRFCCFPCISPQALKMASLSGKLIVITGAGSGIGLACAKVLAARGASLALADINYSQLELQAKSWEAPNDKISLHALDVRDRKKVRAFLENVVQTNGALHGCANIAGVIAKGGAVLPIWEVDSEEYAYTMDVNATGVFNCIAEQLRPGIMERGGSIVNMASAAGLVGLSKNAPYCASKHAVVGLTKASARDAGELGIRVNCVAPYGWICWPKDGQKSLSR